QCVAGLLLSAVPPPRLLPAAGLGIDAGVYRNLVAHMGFPSLAVGDRDLLDLRRKLLPSHRIHRPTPPARLDQDASPTGSRERRGFASVWPLSARCCFPTCGGRSGPRGHLPEPCRGDPPAKHGFAAPVRATTPPR